MGSVTLFLLDLYNPETCLRINGNSKIGTEFVYLHCLLLSVVSDGKDRGELHFEEFLPQF